MRALYKISSLCWRTCSHCVNVSRSRLVHRVLASDGKQAMSSTTFFFGSSRQDVVHTQVEAHKTTQKCTLGSGNCYCTPQLHQCQAAIGKLLSLRIEKSTTRLAIEKFRGQFRYSASIRQARFSFEVIHPQQGNNGV